MINILVITICAYTRIGEYRYIPITYRISIVYSVYCDKLHVYVSATLGECDRKEVSSKKMNGPNNALFYIYFSTV